MTLGLVVNGDLASCKSQTKQQAAPQKRIKSKITYLCCHVYRDLTKSTSRSSLEVAIFKNFPLRGLKNWLVCGLFVIS